MSDVAMNALMEIARLNGANDPELRDVLLAAMLDK
jgi:hypothetical protein